MKKTVSSVLAAIMFFFSGFYRVLAGGDNLKIAVIRNDNVDTTAFWEGINSVSGAQLSTHNIPPLESYELLGRKIHYVLSNGNYIGDYSMNFIDISIPFQEVANPNSTLFRTEISTLWSNRDLVMVMYDATNEPEIGWEQFMLSYTEFVKRSDKYALLMFVPINSEYVDDTQRSWLANFVCRAENTWLRDHPHRGKELPQFISTTPGYRYENVLNQIVREFVERKKKNHHAFAAMFNSKATRIVLIAGALVCIGFLVYASCTAESDIDELKENLSHYSENVESEIII